MTKEDDRRRDRLSDKPPIHNITPPSDVGQRIREAFAGVKPDLDFAAQELRTMASLVDVPSGTTRVDIGHTMVEVLAWDDYRHGRDAAPRASDLTDEQVRAALEDPPAHLRVALACFEAWWPQPLNLEDANEHVLRECARAELLTRTSVALGDDADLREEWTRRLSTGFELSMHRIHEERDRCDLAGEGLPDWAVRADVPPARETTLDIETTRIDGSLALTPPVVVQVRADVPEPRHPAAVARAEAVAPTLSPPTMTTTRDEAGLEGLHEHARVIGEAASASLGEHLRRVTDAGGLAFFTEEGARIFVPATEPPDMTPEEILAAVRATTPAPEYLEAVERALEYPAYTYYIWQQPSLQAEHGGALFRFVGRGDDDRDGSSGPDTCGCLSMVRGGCFSASSDAIAAAIRMDERIVEPAPGERLPREQLHVYAQWQTWLGANVPGRRSVSQFLRDAGVA